MRRLAVNTVTSDHTVDTKSSYDLPNVAVPYPVERYAGVHSSANSAKTFSHSQLTSCLKTTNDIIDQCPTGKHAPYGFSHI